MESKKFCFFTGTDRHHDEVLVFRQASSLMAAGYDVSFIVSDNEPEEIQSGVRIIPNGSEHKGKLRRVIEMPVLTYKKAKEINADVYQTSSVDQLIVGLLLKRKGKRIIFHLREGHPYTLRNRSKLPIWLTNVIIIIMVVWMKFAFRQYDSIITVTDDVADYLKRWGLKNIVVQGNYPIIDHNYTLTLEDYLSRENRLLYFGLIYGLSRQQYVLDALQKVDNVSYLLAGRFNGNMEYYEKLKTHPKWKDVEFIDGFKHEELRFFFKRSTMCNVLRDFSRTEAPNGSLGIIKMFESMEAALPIICSDVPVYRKLMEKYKCGILVDPKNSDEIADAIKYLITHKEEAYRMGQEGRRAVMEKYSWDALSKDYLKIVDGTYNNQNN